MKIQVTSAAQAAKSALVAVLLPEGARVSLDTGAGRMAQALLRRKEWKAKFKGKQLLYGDEKASERLLLIGLGPNKEVTPDKLRQAAAMAAKQAKELGVKTLGILAETKAAQGADAGSALAEGLVLASYHFDARKKEKDKDPYRALTVRLGTDTKSGAFKSGVERGVAVAESQNFARRLGDRPGNELTPTGLGREASQMAKREGLRCRIYRKRDLEQRNMGGILAVAQASVEPPVLIELEHKPRRYKKTICLVGKGLTFDTGGISLKPSANMQDMKYDMCGGAAVLGAMMAVARLKPAVRVIGIVPASDNMPGGAAQKPGDTLVTASGLTVEVLNTDAEGRLILSDALHHATSFEPDHIVDLATLTGACVIALGHDAAGLFSNDEKLQALLQRCGEETADKAWPMPLFDEYKEDLKSPYADLKNLAGREGGAGTAAAFLSFFVGDHSWAHLDIAGTAWSHRSRSYLGKGASGAGVRLLMRFIETQ